MLLRSHQPPGGLTMSKVSKVLAFLTRMKVSLHLIRAHVFFFIKSLFFTFSLICLPYCRMDSADVSQEWKLQLFAVILLIQIACILYKIQMLR